MTCQPVRYLVPSDVVTHMAISLMHASDALKLTALAAAQDPIDPAHMLTTLTVLAHRLDDINEALSAIVAEQNGEADGSPRLC